ncbi:MAG: sigma-54-dependent Fis family transcriptional regulator [Planctomycetes bacterium]|nr:sigma-54-dependent Fis family transcriptional regulator [Planctomycetota bacterium]
MARRVRMLIVDDEVDFRNTMRERFERKNFEVETAPDAPVALNLLDRAFDVALVDIRMPGMDGMTLLRQAKDRCPLLEVIMITGQGRIEAAVEAVKSGAYGYLTKPVRTSELDAAIDRALEHAALSRDRRVRDQEWSRRRMLDDFIYGSPEMKSLEETAARVAATDVTVLLEGETGAGKEVLAQHIHRRSPRAGGPFVVLDCGTLAGSILERELFGHERGAYTGADETRPGLVSIAEGGTLLIDEIAHTSPEVQAKLLRLIERGRYRRLGNPMEMSADVRLLAATNRDLQEKVKSGEFRADLYHRLNVLRLRIPPLRARKEDILSLAAYFLAKHAPTPLGPKRLSPQAEVAMMAYSWPGNVRELGNVIQRASLISTGEEIEPSELGIEDAALGAEGPLSLLAAERKHIEHVLGMTKGDMARAAELLGITVRHLYRKLQKHKLER